tara:strand:+ start:13307 stop:14428 length:1122 start_codon:yes stop_codon:yes gene_type:complete
MNDSPKVSHKPVIPFDYGTLREDAATFYSDNKIFDGFKNVSITKKLMSLAGSFEITMTDKWKAERSDFQLKPGSRIHCHIGKEAVFEGYVDVMNLNITPGSRNITISGRDRTADLIDCSHVGPAEYNKLGIKEIAEQMTAPFGIKVINPFNVDLGSVFEKFTVRVGETVFEALTRAAKQREIVLLTSTHGNLIFDKVGIRQSGTELVEGINVKITGSTFDNSQRFSEYIVKGQQPGLVGKGKETTQSKATAKDNGVTRYRPTIILADQSSDNDAAQKRANFESSFKSAKATKISCTVRDWRKISGDLWAVNELVFIDAKSIGVSGSFLIASVRFNLGDSGRSADLELVRKDAFNFLPEKKKSDDPLDTVGWAL